MAENKRCISCKTEIINDNGSTMFSCPKCEQHEIVRCKHCRELGTRYTCPKCKFTGPN